MGREARQLKILELITKNNIDTQEELVQRLADEGFAVTQATVSRDIKDMNLVKVPAENGKGYRYLVSTPKDNSSDRFINVFKNTVVSIRVAENLVVVKTETGAAQAAAELIDRLNMDCILGVIAGDNTIFVAVEDIAAADRVADRLEEILRR